MYFIFGRNGRELGGMFNMSGDMKMAPKWTLYIQVDSADAARRTGESQWRGSSRNTAEEPCLAALIPRG